MTGATRGKYTGTSFAPWDFSAAPENFIIRVDGGETQCVRISENVADVAAAVVVLDRAKLSGVTVRSEIGNLVLTTNSTGASSQVEVLPRRPKLVGDLNPLKTKVPLAGSIWLAV